MKLKRIELTLFLLLAVLMLWCAGVSLAQRQMAADLVRLRVIAEENDFMSQSRKLLVRDAVLDYCATRIPQNANAAQVQAILTREQNGLCSSIRQVVGNNTPFLIELAECRYPTRSYRDFSLPAGRYVGLQIRLGSAAGKNWWCVLYPELCTAASTAGQYEKTTFAFKSMEWISAFCEKFWS